MGRGVLCPFAPYRPYKAFILDESKELPVSSQVASVLYLDLFEETWKEGYTDLIQVTLNSKGSGTYQAAVLSRNLFYEEHPDAKEQLAIHIIDSKTYSMGYGIAVIEGAQLAKAGASVQEVINHIEEWLAHSRPVFATLDLRCVKKSGRISPAKNLLLLLKTVMQRSSIRLVESERLSPL